MTAPTLNFAAGTYVSALTDDVLVDTGSTQRLRIVSLSATNGSGATTTLTVKVGSNIIINALQAGASINLTHPGGTFTKDWIYCAVGDKITVTSGATTKGSVTVVFEVLSNQ